MSPPRPPGKCGYWCAYKLRGFRLVKGGEDEAYEGFVEELQRGLGPHIDVAGEYADVRVAVTIIK